MFQREQHLLFFRYLKAHNVHLKIKKPRTSKLGDYRHPYRDFGHRISINGNLNRFAFLITLVHEMAHLETWNQHRNKVEPHGIDWKTNFKYLLAPFVAEDIFPKDVLRALEKYLHNPAASSCANLPLSRALANYDETKKTTMESLKEGQLFRLSSGKVFRKGKKLRKRYKCLCVTDNRMYYVNPLVEVVEILEPSTV